MIMKNIISFRYNLTCLLALILGLNMVSCVDNNESDPPIKPFVPGNFITIAELKVKYDGELAKSDYKTRVPVEITQAVTIKGIITTDDNLNGNLYKEAYIEDATGGLLIKLNATGAMNIGDSVMVNLKGLFLGDYGNFIQLGSVPYTDNSGNLRVGNIDVADCMNRFSFRNATNPTNVNLVELKANLNNYLGRLVKIDDVQFANSELGNNYAVEEKDGNKADYGNRKLEDCSKNNIIVRSSGYSSFAGYKLPQGKGSIVGIVTKFTNNSGTTTIQLIIRDINEVKMDGPRCGDGGGTTDPGTIVFEEPFVAGIGNFKAISVKGDQVWQHDATYKYMKVSGNFNKVNYENEDWLVSPAINLTGVNNASLQFDHAGRVFGAPFSDMTVWVSTNFNGTDVAAASWTQVTIPTYMNGNDWVFVNSGAISLAGFNNQATVFVAFKYTSSATLSATWQIKNVKITK